MRKLILSLTLIFCAVLLSTAADKVRVAAVGNSITYGAGIDNPAQNSYPAQLQRVLGDKYWVVNFGASGYSMLSKSDYPYITTGQFKSSVEFNPDIILIKLGTNDTKTNNRDKIKSDYKADYQKLINLYRALPSNPRIILLTPVPCYLPSGAYEGTNKIYEETINPIIQELAYENELEVIDLYHVFNPNAPIPAYIMPDKLHPSAIGAARMVERIAPVLTLSKKQESLAQKVAPKNATKFNFHGYQGYEWGGGYRIVEPRVGSKSGNQWVIRARFWGHEPQTDQALLERGFHIAYCPVENLFGAPVAVERYNQFYKKMIAAGFAPKVVLEGMSRGGLIVYNWAAENAEKVAAIYADAPVMNLSDWPLIKSEGDTKEMMKVYGFKTVDEVKNFKGNPIDKAAKVKNIPIIHVVGMADDVVRVKDNTDRFKDSLQAAGGFMTVIRKEGVGHHPHSLYAPATIVDFILVATNQVANKCATAQAGYEWRSGAGWNDGADWWVVSEEISKVLQRPCDVLMLGNSITQAMGGMDRVKINTFAGKKPITQALQSVLGDSVRWVSAGISGDRTESLLWRLRNGNYQNCKAKFVFITIGVNNLTPGDDPRDVAYGIKAVADEAAAQFPKAKITVFGTFPYSNLEKSLAVANTLSNIEFASNVSFVNPWNWFVDADGKQRVELYNGDHLHLNEAGYVMLGKKIAEICSANNK
ncbi:MAG: GDSL-type esterase/lipase family protein [Mucinivorans sp.]